MRPRFVCSALLVVFANIQSIACMWDYDTLQAETKEFPDVVDTIVGWFPRNPPLYYEMRIKRRIAELKTNPNILDAYDDIAVGYARLGKEKDGLEWLEKQRAILQSSSQADLNVKEHWYHYWANRGTLLVHDWFHRGHKKNEISELQQGEKCIENALRINPNAHFGRERVQLEVMRWAEVQTLHPSSTQDESSSLGEYLADKFNVWGADFDKSKLPQVQQLLQGLDGLVVLGSAWESFDIFEAIAKLLDSGGKAWMAQLALDRCRELQKRGSRSLNPLNNKPFLMWQPSGDKNVRNVNKKELEAFELEQFQAIRDQADQENARRSTYMLPLLQAGRHPDTDPHFWDNFTPRKRPDFHSPRPFFSTAVTNYVFATIYLLILLLIIAVAILLTRRWIGRHQHTT